MKTRLLTAAAVAIAFTLSAGAADAATRHHHRHHHHQAAATSREPSGWHGRAEAAEQTTPHVRYRSHRWRHHRRYSDESAASAGRRHHHHWRRAEAGEAAGLHHARYHHLSAAPTESAGTTAGTACQSVRIHGEWVQRCHFAGQ